MSVHALLRDTRAAGAAEFAMVLPLLLLLLFGIIDAARLAWEYNRVAKATQAGARFAVVTDALDSGMAAENYIGAVVSTGILTQGDRIPADAFGRLVCDKTGCTCETAPCPAAGTFNGDAFGRIVARMQAMEPRITSDHVLVAYSGAGLGYAGDPNGMDVSPTVTVSAAGLTFSPISTLNLIDIPLPDSRTSLTAEDSAGTTSN